MVSRGFGVLCVMSFVFAMRSIDFHVTRNWTGPNDIDCGCLWHVVERKGEKKCSWDMLKVWGGVVVFVCFELLIRSSEGSRIANLICLGYISTSSHFAFGRLPRPEVLCGQQSWLCLGCCNFVDRNGPGPDADD
jgi:hypothetical protein